MKLLHFPPRKGHQKRRRLVVKLPNDSLTSTVKVARWLGVSQRTVTELAQRWQDTAGLEGIPGFKIGRAWRFDTEILEKWLLNKQQPPTVTIEKIKRVG